LDSQTAITEAQRETNVIVNDSDSHRALRIQRIKLAVFTSVLIRPLSVVTSFITVPLFLNYLGFERYGLYKSIGALALWFGLTDAGLTQGLQNRLQDCHVQGDQKLAQRYTSSLIIALAGLVGLTLLVFAGVVWLIDWPKVFSVTDARAAAEIPWAVAVAGGFTLLGSVSSISICIYTAYQEQHKANLWDGAFRVGVLLACIGVVYTSTGLVGVLIAASGVATLLRLCNALYLFGVEKPWLRPRWSLFDWRLVRSTLSDSIFMLVLQMGVVAIFQSDRLIIAVTLGPEQVTPYSIAGDPFLIGYGLFMIMLAPLWPAYGDAIRRGDLAWVYRCVRITIGVGCAGIILFGAVLLGTGHWLFPLWTRDPNVHIRAGLIMAMTATFSLRAWVDSRTIALNSISLFRPQVIFWVAHAILNVGMAFALVRPFGVLGVAWATPVSALLTSVWGYPWLMRRYLNPGAVHQNGIHGLGSNNKLS
jgi:O-antigen/teichoic acid export membrane protein